MPGAGLRGRFKRAARAVRLNPVRVRRQRRRLRRSITVAPCPQLVCLGSAYGGYVVPAHLPRSDWIAYCGGVGEDASFERELARRYGCHVFAFDPTPRSIRYAREELAGSGVSFLPYALGSEDREVRFYAPRRSEDVSYSMADWQETAEFILVRCRSIESLMAELGHERLNLLKLDIEGAEYEVLEPVLEGRRRVDVLCVELHPVPSFDAMHRCLERLTDVGYRVVHLDKADVTLVESSHLS
jgi:FkbM family methyltransferase